MDDITDLLYRLDSDGMFQKYSNAAIGNYWKTKKGKKAIIQIVRDGFGKLAPDERAIIRKLSLIHI